MSLFSDFQEVRKVHKAEAISRKIHRLSTKQKKIRVKKGKLTHKREKLLGQGLSQLPRGAEG